MINSAWRKTFPFIDEVDWLTNPTEAERYLHTINQRKNKLQRVGSTLPLKLAKISLDGLTDGRVRQQFDAVSSTFSHEITNPRLVRLQKTREFQGETRLLRAWHVDHTPPIPRINSFRFILSATMDPTLTTRYAPEGSPIIHTRTSIRQYQAEPPAEEIVQGEGDAVYLMPFNQTVHVSPDQPNGEAVLFNRYVHFAYTKQLDEL